MRIKYERVLSTLREASRRLGTLIFNGQVYASVNVHKLLGQLPTIVGAHLEAQGGGPPLAASAAP